MHHLRTGILAALLSVAAAASASACALSLPREVKPLVAQINAVRAQHGQAPLRVNGTLDKIAQSHACDNAQRKSYSHTGGDGTELGDRLKRGGYRLRAAAENTGLGRFDAARMVQFWMNSPPHRANLLGRDYTELGLGIAATQDGRNAWVLVMAKSR